MSARRAALALAGALVLVAAGCADPAPRGPNLVLVTLDTTRADHLGLHGYFRDTSPRLDEFAQESIVFDRALAPMATTLPSHTSLFTATYPLEHGVIANIQHGGLRFAPSPALRSVAELAHGGGYRTAGFVSAAPLKSHSGIQAGFEVFDEPQGEATHRRGDVTTGAALRWLAERGDEPFLLWVHYFDAHWPFMAPDSFTSLFRSDAALESHLARRRFAATSYREGVGSETTEETVNAYDAELRFQDTHLGRLLDALRARPDWDRTAVVIVGDHGEGLGQHGHSAHGGTWHEQLWVPLLIRVPGVPPRRVEDAISVVDALPTLVALLEEGGWEAPALAGLSAQASGRPASAPAPDRAVFSQETGRKAGRDGYRWALTTRRWKYVGAQGSDEHELYDLESDPFELTDVADRHEEVVERMAAELARQLAAQQARSAALHPDGLPQALPTDPGVAEQLRALGYVDDGEPPPPPPGSS